MMKDFLEYKTPSNELLSKVIDKIVIDKDKNIEIYFKFDVSKYIQLEKKRRQLINSLLNIYLARRHL